MSADNEVIVTIGAQTSDLKDGMASAASSFDESTAQIKGGAESMAAQVSASMSEMSAKITEGLDSAKEKFESFNSTLEGIGSSFGAFGAILAGGIIGEKLKELVMSTAELGDKLLKTSQITGTTVESLSELKYAASLSDVSFETLRMGLTKLSLSMQQTAQGTGTAKLAFAALGISVTNSTGGLKTSQEVLTELATKFQGMQDGAGKTATAMQIFGRAGAQLIPMLDKGASGMAAAAAEAKKLGIVMSTSAAEASEKLNDDIKRMHAAFQGVGQQLAQEFIPAISSLATAFTDSMEQGGLLRSVMEALSATMQAVAVVIENVWQVVKQLATIIYDACAEIGSSILSVFGQGSSPMSGLQLFKNMLGVVEVAFIGLRVGIETSVQIIIGLLTSLVSAAVTMADVVERAMHLDFAGAEAAWRNGMNNLKGIVADNVNQIVAIANKGAADINTALGVGSSAKKMSGGEEGGSKSASPIEASSKKGHSNEMAQWQEELNQKKEATSNYFKNSLDMENVFWTDKLGLVKKGSKDYIAIEHQLYSIHKQQAQQSLAADLQTIRSQISDAAAGSIKRIQLAQEAAKKIGDAYGTESQQYVVAVREVKKEADAWNKYQEKLLAQAADAQKTHDLGMIALEKERLNTEKQMGTLSNTEELARLKDLKTKEYAIELDALEKKKTIYATDLQQQQLLNAQILALKQKNTMDMLKLDDQMLLAQKANWTQMAQPIVSAFDTSIKGMIMGTQTFQKAMANMAQSIAGELINTMIKQIVTAWSAGEAAKTAATVGGTADRTAAEQGASLESLAISAAAAIKQIANAAWTAASNVFSSTAAIPYIGPELAPGAALAASATVLGFGASIASASGGWGQVPSDQMAMIHKNEMVLPAHLAGGVRDMVKSGGGSGVNVTNHFHLHQPTDRRTQMQIAASAGIAIQTAIARNK